MAYDSTKGRPRIRIPQRMIIAAVFAVIAVIGYLANTSTNPVTGKVQHISLTPEQEVALGLQSAPQMAQQFGGLSADANAAQLVKTVGAAIVRALPPDSTPYPFEYHLLADRRTVNAFALPGGQIFITEALLARLETEGQLAGILGHETGHVIARHSAAQMAKGQLTQGLVTAVGVAGSDSAAGQRQAAAVAGMVGNMINMKYGRNDELEADALGLQFMLTAGYDPRSMIRVMEILREASGGSGQPEFMSTHPDPGNRVQQIEAWLKQHAATDRTLRK